MRKVLLTTTALIALGSVAAVAADMSISGNSRFRYNQWSDDDEVADGANNSSMADVLQLWFNTSATTDSGLTIGANIRMRTGGTTDRNYINIDGDHGSIQAGKQWAPVYSYSLGENWAGTVAGSEYYGASDGDTAITTDDGPSRGNIFTDTYQTTSALANKVVYNTPSINGLKVGVSFSDGGATSDANATSVAAKYSFAMGDGTITAMYGSENAGSAKGAATSTDSEVSQMGVQYAAGFGRVWAVSMTESNTENSGSHTLDQEGSQFGIVYNLNSATKVLAMNTSTEEAASASQNAGDTFNANAVGIRYDIAGGMRLGLLHTQYDYHDATHSSAAAGEGSNDGSATRLELRVNF
jgi:hypothetical protein